MIVIELEEKKYGKTMEALTKIKEYTECLSEILEDHAMGNRMPRQSKRYEDEYPERSSRREYRDDYRGDYTRYM